MTQLVDWASPFPPNCGQCRASSWWAVRDDGGSWSVWPRTILPTGVRIDAWLCGLCLREVVGSSVQLITGMRLYSPSGEGKRSAMSRLMVRLRGETR